jgi:hypothetical protein
VTPQFRIGEKNGFWTLDIFYITTEENFTDFSDWVGFEEPFSEGIYRKMQDWCEKNFKTWLFPRRARRMSYNQFWFKSKKDLDWFVLFWSGVDITD